MTINLVGLNNHDSCFLLLLWVVTLFPPPPPPQFSVCSSLNTCVLVFVCTSMHVDRSVYLYVCVCVCVCVYVCVCVCVFSRVCFDVICLGSLFFFSFSFFLSFWMFTCCCTYASIPCHLYWFLWPFLWTHYTVLWALFLFFMGYSAINIVIIKTYSSTEIIYTIKFHFLPQKQDGQFQFFHLKFIFMYPKSILW